MRLEAKKYLYDIRQAAGEVAEFTTGKQFSDYERDPMLRAAVERKFEIIGEALGNWPDWTRCWPRESANTAASSPSATS